MYGRALLSPARAELLEQRASFMRCRPTRSEEWLWRRLSGSKTGVGFRRQPVIGEYIDDFACTKARPVVEVDGPYHERRERHDAARDRSLREMGWHVVRVAERHVFADLDAVVATIAHTAHRLAAPRR